MAASAVPAILVVEDDRDVREMMALALTLGGYRVCTAPNGEIALEQAHMNCPDLIVLDLNMPVMSGWLFLEARQKDPLLSAVPVVVVTAGPDSHAEGATAFMRKPFRWDTLLTTVASLCGGPEHRDGPSL